jgi:hypothetical protein
MSGRRSSQRAPAWGYGARERLRFVEMKQRKVRLRDEPVRRIEPRLPRLPAPSHILLQCACRRHDPLHVGVNFGQAAQLPSGRQPLRKAWSVKLPLLRLPIFVRLYPDGTSQPPVEAPLCRLHRGSSWLGSWSVDLRWSLCLQRVTSRRPPPLVRLSSRCIEIGEPQRHRPRSRRCARFLGLHRGRLHANANEPHRRPLAGTRGTTRVAAAPSPAVRWRSRARPARSGRGIAVLATIHCAACSLHRGRGLLLRRQICSRSCSRRRDCRAHMPPVRCG